MTAADEERPEANSRRTTRDDWPRGFEEASWWPVVTVLGAVLSTFGVGAYLVGRTVRAIVDPWVGIALSIVGLVVLVTGVLTWAYHAFVVDYREKQTTSNRERYLWGTLTYVVAEIAVLGGGFLYFAFVYFGTWPPGDLPPMLTRLVWGMTAIMLVSTFTMYFSGQELRDGNGRRFLVLLGVSPLLGVLFLLGKLANYHRLVVQEGFGISSGVYWSAFFALDGLHGVLVAVGITLLLWVLGRALAGHYSPDDHVSLTTAAMYWWIVEAVWLLLLVEIYATAALCRANGTC